jgi:hypothetical protein
VKIKKLSLNKETLKCLKNESLLEVAGGYDTVFDCAPVTGAINCGGDTFSQCDTQVGTVCLVITDQSWCNTQKCYTYLCPPTELVNC